MAMTTSPDNLGQLLDDPNVITLTVEQAYKILGIGRSTAIHAYQRTGYLIAGVPVLRVGRRCLVSASHLRAALGRPEPTK